jgi:Spy/CpxP family protein refolding chaperone
MRPEEDHMFLGILIGTICLIGLVRALVGRRYYGGFHHYGGYGYGPPGWGGWGGYGHGAYGGRRRGFLYSILARLDATPTQEKAILTALDELKDTARELRGTVRETRGDVARTLRGPTFDESALDTAEKRFDDAAQRMRRAAGAALAKIHEVLDDRQRKVLSEMIESGWAAGC